MELLLLRHAKAEERAAFARTGGGDGQRPLTREGARRMARVARDLHAVLPRIDRLASSPLLRAVQTAGIVAREYGEEVIEAAELAPGLAPSALLRWLDAQKGCEVIAAVGHEPDLGQLASWLLSGAERSFMPFRKGGACLIRFAGAVGAGRGELVWALGPAQLRALRR